jgi:hypothetical protein
MLAPKVGADHFNRPECRRRQITFERHYVVDVIGDRRIA